MNLLDIEAKDWWQSALDVSITSSLTVKLPYSYVCKNASGDVCKLIL
jgi:hypothetical protein